MAITYSASTIVVSGTGDQTVKGPVEIIGIIVPTAGTAVLKKGANTIFTLSAGQYQLKVRSAADLTINGACTLLLK
jgi:hypothetical protein